MMRLGFDISSHRSTVLSKSQARSAARIFCVSRRHADVLVREYGVDPSRVGVLGADIPDPWHGPQKEYDETAATMLEVVPHRLHANWKDVSAALEASGADLVG